MDLCNDKAQILKFNAQSLGRAELAQRYFPNIQPMSAWLKLKALLLELAQRYFPNIQPMSAWLKLKALLLDDPALEHLARLRRRTFLPCEVNIIYQQLGQP